MPSPTSWLATSEIRCAASSVPSRAGTGVRDGRRQELVQHRGGRSSVTAVRTGPGGDAQVLGMGLPPSGTLHREFHRAQARYNRMHPDEVPPVASIHAVRHGWATLSLESGVPIRVVQDRLNHSSEKVAADIYTQVREAAQSDVAERVAAQVFGPGDLGSC
jgi:integrase